MSKFSFTKVFKRVIYLDGNLTGRQFLKLVLIGELISAVFSYSILIIYITAFLQGHSRNTSFWVRVARWFNAAVSHTTSPIRIYLIWNGLKTPSKLKRNLKIYLISFYILMIPMWVVVTYARGDIFHGGRWGFQNYVAVFIQGFFLIFLPWVLWRLGYNIERLDSPIMLQFRDYINLSKKKQKKAIKLTLGIPSPPIPPRNVNSQEDNEIERDASENERLDHTVSNDFSNQKLEILESHIISPLDIVQDDKSPLANGMFGIVHKGRLIQNGTEVDIVMKTIIDLDNSMSFNMLLDEVKTLVRVGDHVNIVKFYGVTSDNRIKDHFAIVNEYCSKGSLQDYLEANKIFLTAASANPIQSPTPDYYVLEINGPAKSSTTAKVLLRFVLKICTGMEHLAMKKVVHGDLASRNVLLTETLQIKITDFGLSRRLYNYQVYSKVNPETILIPWRWMPVEVLEDLKFSEKSDVWSFGVTAWEIFTMGDLPFDELDWSAEIPQKLRNGLCLSKPSLADAKLYELMQDCWSIGTEERPTFTQLREKIEPLFQNLA